MQAELPRLPRTGDKVDRYRVILEVAHGGMAAVYAVQRSSIGGFEKVHAMKMLLPHLATDPHFVNMFLDEARLASQIQHPNVVQVLDVGMHERLPYLLMEFMRGQSLSRVVRRAKDRAEPLPLGFCMGVLARTALGLHAAHETVDAEGTSLGVVHRDISPHNIFIGYDGQVKVVDFGIAAARGRLVDTRSGEIKGKLAYLAPEFLNALPVTRQADLWALGVVGWEALTGERLFSSKDEAATMWNVLNAPIDDLSRRLPDLPGDSGRALMACLDRSAAKRPQDGARVAETFAKDFAAVQDGQIEPCVAALMGRLFGQERGIEQERLAAAVRVGSPPRLKEPEPTSDEALAARTLPEDTAATRVDATLNLQPRRKRRFAVAIGALGVVALSVVVAWRSGLVAKYLAPQTAVAGDETRSIRVDVDARALEVLVDGTRHDERPVRLRLSRNEVVEVELTAADGARVLRRISSRDDGVLIAFPVLAPAPVASTSAMPEASASSRPIAKRTTSGSVSAVQPKPKATPKVAKPDPKPLLNNPF